MSVLIGVSIASWTDDDIAHARKLRTDGRSASEIGRELGRTRNSVIGMMHRNRDLFPLSTKAQAVEAMKRRDRATDGTPRQSAARPAPGAKPVALPSAPPLDAFKTAPLPETDENWSVAVAVRFLDVDSRHCKWPLWKAEENPGPAGLCCGAAIEPNTTYCRHHRRIATGQGTPSERAAAALLQRTAR